MEVENSRVHRVILVLAAVCLPFFFAPRNACANIVDNIGGAAKDAWSIAVDPLKLGRASGNILDSVERIQAVLDKVRDIESITNADIKNRIQQVQDLVDSIQSDAATDIAAAYQAILSLEARIYLDASDLIYQVHCLADTTLKNQLPDALARLLDEINDSNLGINILGFRLVGLGAKHVVIVDPDKAFIYARDKQISMLKNIGENDDAYLILSAYGAIIQDAESALCNYRGRPLSGFLLEEEVRFERLSAPWTIIRPAPMVQ